MDKIRSAVAVPFSSIVGSSVTLHNDKGVAIGQLALLGIEGSGDEWKANCIEVATFVAEAINEQVKKAE